METERKGTILGQACDLNKIPIKSIRVVQYNSNDYIPHGCIVGLPKNKHTQNNQEIIDNPIPIFSSLLSELSDAHLSYGTFIFANNYMHLKQYSSNITANTLFYYLRFEHKTDCTFFIACAKKSFNVCLYSKKISPKHLHEFRKYEDIEYNTHDENLDDEIQEIDNQNNNNNTDNNTDNNNNENVYDYEEEEDKEEEKQEEATPPPGTSITARPTVNHRPNIMQSIIETPYGRAPMNKLLQIKFIEHDILLLSSIPIKNAYPNIICSRSWFGQFGTIIDIKIYDGKNSQCKCVQIKYDNEISAKNGLSYCKNNGFGVENIELDARLGMQKYCPFFLAPNASCTTKNCPDIHKWKTKNKNNCNKSNNCKNNDLILRDKMSRIAQNISSLSIDELPKVFQSMFNQNIHNLYPGNLTGLVKYFKDIFVIKYNRNKTKCWIMSKIHQQNENNKENNKENNNNNNTENRNNNYNGQNYTKRNYTKRNYTEQNKTNKNPKNNENYNQQNENNNIINEQQNNNDRNWDEYSEQQTNQQNDNKENHQIENNNNEQNCDEEKEENHTEQNSNICVNEINEIENKKDDNEENILDANIICKNKFKFWLCNICKLEQYLSAFEQKNYNDITMVEFFDEEILKDDLCMSSVLHIRLLLKRVNQFKIMMNEFDQILTQIKKLNGYKQSLMQYGILTINDLRNDVQSINDVKRIFNVNNQEKALALLETINHIV